MKYNICVTCFSLYAHLFFSVRQRELINLSSGVIKDRKGRKTNVTLKRVTHPIQPTPGTDTFHENNENFYLCVAAQQAVCASCKCDILYKTANVKDRLCFKHNERYMYPTTIDSNGKWKESTITHKKMRPHYYHAKPHCIYSRFRSDYFDNMPVVISHEAVDHEKIDGFTHPSLN